MRLALTFAFALLHNYHAAHEDPSSTYTSNATNVIAQNSINSVSPPNTTSLLVEAGSSAKAANFKSYLPEDSFANNGTVASTTTNASTEKLNPASNRKYTISPQFPKNIIVKKMLDRLLTPYLADKLVISNDEDVLKMLTSNTRNPYLIWENATRVQLVDFLETQRLTSAKHQYEDMDEVQEIVDAFEFDAHRYVLFMHYIL